jgi:hypothetical protein
MNGRRPLVMKMHLVCGALAPPLDTAEQGNDLPPTGPTS